MIQFQENIASQSRVSQILELWRNKKQCQANWSINLPLSDFFPLCIRLQQEAPEEWTHVRSESAQHL